MKSSPDRFASLHRQGVTTLVRAARRDQRDHRSGFTFGELLVVLVAFGLLLALLTPAMQAARNGARQLQCGNNLKQLGLALLNYHETYGVLPASYHSDVGPGGKLMQLTTWGLALLPYLEQNNMAKLYDHRFAPVDQSLGGNASLGVIAINIASFHCPAHNSVPATYKGQAAADSLPGFPAITWTAAISDYSVTSGVRGEFSRIAYGARPPRDLQGALRPWARVAGRVVHSQVLRLGDITDGTSSTTVLGERTGGERVYRGRQAWDLAAAQQLAWGAANGGGWGDPLAGEHWLGGSPQVLVAFPPGEGPCGINCTNLRHHGFHGFHPLGGNFCRADGAIVFVHADVAPLILAAQITARGQEMVDD